MSEKNERKAHGLNYSNNVLTVNGVVQVVEISEKEAQLKLSDNTVVVRGKGLNVVKLDREQGVVQLETQEVQSVVYRANGLNVKGFFR